MSEQNMKTPCQECPFSKRVAPGALGGGPVSKYVGQIIGPFLLPCHSGKTESGIEYEEAKDTGLIRPGTFPQCAGAAIMRANLGLDQLMPKEIHHLDPDTDKSFGSISEFAAHHYDCCEEVADGKLVTETISRIRIAHGDEPPGREMEGEISNLPQEIRKAAVLEIAKAAFGLQMMETEQKIKTGRPEAFIKKTEP